MRRVRRQHAANFSGYVVTWDVNSSDGALCARLRRFVFGKTTTAGGKAYHYPGFVELEGVRYLGQSVLFVQPERVQAILRFLRTNGIDHVLMQGSLGAVVRR